MSGDGQPTATPMATMAADLPCAVCGRQSAMSKAWTCTGQPTAGDVRAPGF